MYISQTSPEDGLLTSFIHGVILQSIFHAFGRGSTFGEGSNEMEHQSEHDGQRMVYISPEMALIIVNVATTIIARVEGQMESVYHQDISIPGFTKMYKFKSAEESRQLVDELDRLRHNIIAVFGLDLP
jgi:hypothetical protein